MRTGILASLGFLIVTAMVLINVVMVKFQERDLIEAKLETGRLLIHILARQAADELAHEEKGVDRPFSRRGFKEKLWQLIQRGGFSDALILDRGGVKVYSMGSWAAGPSSGSYEPTAGGEEPNLRPESPTVSESYESPAGRDWKRPRKGEAERDAMALSAKALKMRKWAFDFCGSTWGVIWFAPQRVNISSPVLLEGRLMGAITISSRLDPLYEKLRESEKTILIYIILNTIILVLFGFYLLSLTVVRPIYRLLHITNQFKDGVPFPSFGDSPRNEIGQLSQSLHMMLGRLEENKKELRSHISSLEKANQEIKKAQEEIIRSEKAASVGRLATGVAHEIGNPIGIILGYLELLRGEDLEEEERRDFLERIESELTRISRIIKQLLDFSRPSTGERKLGKVHNMIMETVSMLRPQPMMAHIDIEMALNAARDKVWAGPDQLKQVFLNIIMNSADSMQGDRSLDNEDQSGVLRIRTENIGDSIEIRFSDTGEGIPEEELIHIFDPFYTTKEPGKGTGLGLSISYRIIEGLGGEIRAESSPGKGATIIINIPLHEGEEK
ncbi:MAG: ATP-binding protein [Pseudomonadota bacterium]